MQIDRIIRSRRKTISIEVQPGGKVVVRAPLHASDLRIQAALMAKAGWLEQAKKRMALMDANRLPKSFCQGELFWYLGKQYPLSFTTRGKAGLRFDERTGFWLLQSKQGDALKSFIHWYREQTRKLVSNLVEQYRIQYGLKVGDIRITSAKTRWGSCSVKNSLNFTYRLSMAPLPTVEYVVAHELAHTRVKNHGAQFWSLVESIYPNWKKERSWLNHHGSRLTLE